MLWGDTFQSLSLGPFHLKFKNNTTISSHISFDYGRKK